MINAIDDNKTEFNSAFIPFISKKLRELIEIPEPNSKKEKEFKQQIEDIKKELEQTKKELKEQISGQLMKEMKDIKELLLSKS